MAAGRYYNVRMRQGTNEKMQKVYATSESNARYEAEKQNPGYTVTDVQPG